MIKRRHFIAGIGVAAAWPQAPRAQLAGAPVVGFLGSASASTQGAFLGFFAQRLRELGWADGTVKIEVRWAEGRDDVVAALAAEIVRANVNVIVSVGTLPTTAAKQATNSIPIVFVAVADPLAEGLVESLARPGGNVTGLSAMLVDTSQKRLQLLKQAMPALRHVAIMGNVGNPGIVLDMRAAQSGAAALGLDAITVEIKRAEDIERAFATLGNHVEALYVSTDQLTITNRNAINTFALVAHLPICGGVREQIDPGGLMSYGQDNAVLYRRAAEMVDKILRGTKPGDIPVEQPTKLQLVVNLTTARALGLKIPDQFLLLADELIE